MYVLLIVRDQQFFENNNTNGYLPNSFHQIMPDDFRSVFTRLGSSGDGTHFHQQQIRREIQRQAKLKRDEIDRQAQLAQFELERELYEEIALFELNQKMLLKQRQDEKQQQQQQQQSFELSDAIKTTNNNNNNNNGVNKFATIHHDGLIEDVNDDNGGNDENIN